MPTVAYRLAVRVVHRLPLGAGKLGQSVEGRRRADRRWVRWAANVRRSGPVAWFHAASVGEAQTAEAVIGRLRTMRSDLTVVLSCSSPALTGWPRRFGADHLDYVPLDEPAPVRRVLAALRPSVLVFSRGDLWPELARQAAAREIPLAVIGAAIRPASQRLRWPTRQILGHVAGSLRWVGAVSRADAARWRFLGAPAAALAVTGDPRHDATLERPTDLSAIQPALRWGRNRRVLVAGSVERGDEAVLLEALRAVRSRHEDARLLLVPHEPSDATTKRLLHKAHALGIEAAQWVARAEEIVDATCVVVRPLGVLSDLYVLAYVAYVGGGFRPRGLHAVIEPAAYGSPVIFGPRWTESADARSLLAFGGSFALPPARAGTALADRWLDWLRDPAARATVGLAARRTLEDGAATRTAAALLRLLPPPRAHKTAGAPSYRAPPRQERSQPG